jgi:hypothetical protein
MARMVPNLTNSLLEQLKEKSNAEAKFYLACKEQLGAELLVIHSLAWISSLSSRQPRNGETDFIIFDPNCGFIVVEVKGGGVRYDPNTSTWYSIGSRGTFPLSESPFIQALREKNATLEQIKRQGRWNNLGIGFISCGYGVFFPDVDDVSSLLELPEARPEIVGKMQDLADLSRWHNCVVNFWNRNSPPFTKLGKVGMGFIEDLFCKPREIQPLLSTRIADVESIRIKLTDEQSNRLRLLGRRKRAAICGGAGTGKTILAVEKAKRLADEGLKTLLLCYNELLGEKFRDLQEEIDNLTAINFHKFCNQRINASKNKSGTDPLKEAEREYPGADLYKVLFPYALWLANDDFQEEKFDAVIVDEGQDFCLDFWEPILDLLKDEENSYLYIFFDSNQMIYQKDHKFPIGEEPYTLTKNCRNTLRIHNACYQYYRGEPTDPPIENIGIPIQQIIASNLQKQSQALTRHVVKLLHNEDITADQIVVLIADNYYKQHYYNELKKLQNQLPRGIQWGIEALGCPSTIKIDTVQRYKGLEASVVFLWGIDELAPDSDRETIYVALSRPKDLLILVGKEGTQERLLKDEFLLD